MSTMNHSLFSLFDACGRCSEGSAPDEDVNGGSNVTFVLCHSLS